MKPSSSPFENSSLKQLLLEVLKSKGDYSDESLRWIDQETVEINNVSPLTLHSFVLKAEALGKDVSYTKQTIISIS